MTTNTQQFWIDCQQMQCLNQRTILIVDDDDLCLRLFQLLFEQLGATVKTAQIEHEAASLILEEPPDLLICDIWLPGKSGLELMRWIRSIPISQKTMPAIALSADSQLKTQHQCLKAGFQRFMLKPVFFNELIAESYALLNDKGSQLSKA